MTDKRHSSDRELRGVGFEVVVDSYSFTQKRTGVKSLIRKVGTQLGKKKGPRTSKDLNDDRNHTVESRSDHPIDPDAGAREATLLEYSLDKHQKNVALNEEGIPHADSARRDDEWIDPSVLQDGMRQDSSPFNPLNWVYSFAADRTVCGDEEDEKDPQNDSTRDRSVVDDQAGGDAGYQADRELDEVPSQNIVQTCETTKTNSASVAAEKSSTLASNNQAKKDSSDSASRSLELPELKNSEKDVTDKTVSLSTQKSCHRGRLFSRRISTYKASSNPASPSTSESSTKARVFRKKASTEKASDDPASLPTQKPSTKARVFRKKASTEKASDDPASLPIQKSSTKARALRKKTSNVKTVSDSSSPQMEKQPTRGRLFSKRKSSTEKSLSESASQQTEKSTSRGRLFSKKLSTEKSSSESASPQAKTPATTGKTFVKKSTLDKSSSESASPQTKTPATNESINVVGTKSHEDKSSNESASPQTKKEHLFGKKSSTDKASNQPTSPPTQTRLPRRRVFGKRSTKRTSSVNTKDTKTSDPQMAKRSNAMARSPSFASRSSMAIKTASRRAKIASRRAKNASRSSVRKASQASQAVAASVQRLVAARQEAAASALVDAVRTLLNGYAADYQRSPTLLLRSIRALIVDAETKAARNRRRITYRQSRKDNRESRKQKQQKATIKELSKPPTGVEHVPACSFIDEDDMEESSICDNGPSSTEAEWDDDDDHTGTSAYSTSSSHRHDEDYTDTEPEEEFADYVWSEQELTDYVTDFFSEGEEYTDFSGQEVTDYCSEEEVTDYYSERDDSALEETTDMEDDDNSYHVPVVIREDVGEDDDETDETDDDDDDDDTVDSRNLSRKDRAILKGIEKDLEDLEGMHENEKQTWLYKTFFPYEE